MNSSPQINGDLLGSVFKDLEFKRKRSCVIKEKLAIKKVLHPPLSVLH